MNRMLALSGDWSACEHDKIRRTRQEYIHIMSPAGGNLLAVCTLTRLFFEWSWCRFKFDKASYGLRGISSEDNSVEEVAFLIRKSFIDKKEKQWPS